ncbi:hypothetical protein ACLFLT_25030 [Klebsiella pneumoniae]
MTEFPVVLVINCGSSSIKFSVLDAASCDCLLNGVAEGINAERASLLRSTAASRWRWRSAATKAPAGDCRSISPTRPHRQRGPDWPPRRPQQRFIVSRVGHY